MNLTLNGQKDETIWSLTKNGIFSVKSFYKALKLQETASMIGGSQKNLGYQSYPES